MQRGTLQIMPELVHTSDVVSYLCLHPFVAFLQNKVATETSNRIHFYQYLLRSIEQSPELLQSDSLESCSSLDEILELIAAVIIPLVNDERESMVGLSKGISSEVFYYTDAFKAAFENHGIQVSTGDSQYLKLITERHLQIQYDLILQKVFGQQKAERTELIHGFFDESIQRYRYYRLHIDTRFVQIHLKPDAKPIEMEAINYCLACKDDATLLLKELPLDRFIANGFSIITLTDVSVQQAIEEIAKSIALVNKETSEQDFQYLTRLVHTVLGNHQYQFGLMPFFTINNRAALPYEQVDFSILVKTSAAAGISKKVFTRYLNHYLKNPGFISYTKDDPQPVLPAPVIKALDKAGVDQYGLMPLYFNDTLVGIAELAAPAGVPELNELQVSQLKPAIPYLAQLMKFVIDRFNNSIDEIVKKEFTNIQPSVQWKFNEVAWHYFRSRDIEHKNAPLEKVFFKEVYPLYGAVDIRNSTIERNKALREDLQLQLNLLTQILESLSWNDAVPNLLPLITVCHEWIGKTSEYVSVEAEHELNVFLYNKVHPVLMGLQSVPERTLLSVKEYFKAIDEQTGVAYTRRRQLEQSIAMINTAVGQYFDLFKDELQQYYPCYFEKFRTDGVEYDIYIGQSIAPTQPFLMEHLDRLKLWQVQSMAAVATMTHALQSQMEFVLQTTQLIFVNARTIDILFRNDERRFDVEGAYNIRYHIVKKRIDKVHVRISGERLTQPGKIAIVYFNEKDAAPYISCIHQLQQQQLLQDDLEYLELEELQGVSGLRALRVGVKI